MVANELERTPEMDTRKKDYDLRFTTCAGFDRPPLRVRLDLDDDETLRAHLVELAVMHDGRPRSRAAEWIGEYTLRVCRPGTSVVEREFVAVR